MDNKKILGISTIEEIIKDTYRYANGKINNYMLCDGYELVDYDIYEGKLACCILNKIYFSIPNIRKYMMDCDTYKEMKVGLVHIVLHELSHVNQYRPSCVQGNDSYKKIIRKRIEDGNEANTQLFMHKHKKELQDIISVAEIIDSSNMFTASVASLIKSIYYIQLSDNNIYEMLNDISTDKLRMPLNLIIHNNDFDINKDCTFIRELLIKKYGEKNLLHVR